MQNENSFKYKFILVEIKILNYAHLLRIGFKNLRTKLCRSGFDRLEIYYLFNLKLCHIHFWLRT